MSVAGAHVCTSFRPYCNIKQNKQNGTQTSPFPHATSTALKAAQNYSFNVELHLHFIDKRNGKRNKSIERGISTNPWSHKLCRTQEKAWHAWAVRKTSTVLETKLKCSSQKSTTKVHSANETKLHNKAQRTHSKIEQNLQKIIRETCASLYICSPSTQRH